jgi:anaerobic ribonucleoside-triphosphate reductase
LSNRIIQQTLEGLSVSAMPRVRTTDGHLLDWDRDAIAKQLVKETKLSEQFYKVPSITEEEARDIAREVERRVRWMNVKYLSGPLVREIMNVVLLERHHPEWRNICTRVGTPVFDAHLIDIGTGFESKENANLQENAETSHKKKADKISKEQYLLLLPPYLADRHLAGDLHIHDLEYFGTRPFCQDWDLRYFFYYGLMPDGLGTKASVAGPAKKPEVAMLHAVKALGSAQTNFAGGQGFYNFLTFIAPYLQGQSYEEIKQLMQMFVYEMTQMMVARGGQLVFSSVQLTPGVPTLWKDKPAVYAGKVWDGVSAEKRTYGEFEREVRLAFKALMEVMLSGDHWGKPFNFPKPEISIEPDFMKEDMEFNAEHPDLPTYQDLYLLTFKLAAEYGTPYFDNQLPAYRGAGKGISCYQCLAGDELVPVVGDSGEVQVRQIEDMFAAAAKNGLETDLNGTEFAELEARTPSIDFETFKGSLKAFRGVMRREYSGKLLNVILTSGRRIRVTPDHPVFALEEGAFVRKQARDLGVGDFLPVLKSADFGTNSVHVLNIGETLIDAGFASEIIASDGEVNIKNARKPGLPKQIPVTSELIRFLGHYLAEGCSDHCGRRYSVRLSFGKHEIDLIEDASRCLHNIGFDPKTSVEKTATNIVVNSKLLYLLIEALGCGHNAHDKSVPDLLFNVEPSLAGQYISCAFQGDGNIDVQVDELEGYIHAAHNIRMRLVSRDAVQKLIFLAQRIGVQMNYMVRDETVKHPHTGEPYGLISYTCYITSQDQIKRFYRDTGYGSDALSGSSRNVGGAFTRIPIKETALSYSDLKYPSQYRSSEYNSVNQRLILEDSRAEALQKLVEGDIHPLMIREIAEEDYDGYVYDLVDVSDTHNFSNALGIVTGNCCAYQFAATYDSDSTFEEKLHFKDGMHFSMGSWQVVSLNCPRAAYLARGDDELLFEYLRELMDTSVEIFKVKREWMNQILKSHRMPFATQQPRDPITGERGSVAVGLEGLVYTIGVVGVNEMVQFHTGQQMHESRDSWKLAVRAMTEMEIYAKKLSAQHGMTIALARTPAETTAQRFAVSDLIHEEFRECAERVVKGDLQSVKNLQRTRDLPVYYTNGTHLPPSADVPIFERARLEHVFFPIVDGGNIFHIFMGEATPDPQGLMDFGMRLARETQVGYFTFTKDMTVCLGCYKVSPGLKDNCPNCGSSEVDHISRITGYLQAVSGWNSAKRQELEDRKRYNDLT